MNEWLSRPPMLWLGWSLAHFIWQGLVIGVLLAICLRLLRAATANARYLAACAALMLMALAPVMTFYSIVAESESVEVQPVEHTVSVIYKTGTVATQPLAAPTKSQSPSTANVPHKKMLEKLTRVLPWLVAAWCAGVLMLSVRLLGGWVQVSRLKRAATKELSGQWLELLERTAARLGVIRPVRLLQSAWIEVPAVIGWLRPVILMPAGCLTGLTPRQLEAILAHELAHIRRHDYLINLLQNAVETLLFYHPVVWWVSRRIRTEREHCCDDLAVKICGDAVGYARALATLEELRPASAQLAVAASGAPLLERIRRLLGKPERNPSRPAWPVAGLAIVTVTIFLAVTLRYNAASARTAEAPRKLAKIKQEPPKPAASATTNNLPQILIQSKWVEMDVSKTGTNGLDWLYENGRARIVTNSTATFELAEKRISAPLDKSERFHETYLSSNVVPVSLMAFLSEQGYAGVMKTLEQINGVDVLSSPKVTTEMGRQAQVMVGDTMSVVVRKPTGPGDTNATATMVCGLSVDLIPTLSEDGKSINLTVIGEVSEFLGYDPGKEPLPRIRKRTFSTKVTIADGETLILGSPTLPLSQTKTVKRKVPILGEIPILGHVFTSENSATKTMRKNLMLFIRPQLVNPDGTRYREEPAGSGPKANQDIQDTAKRGHFK